MSFLTFLGCFVGASSILHDINNQLGSIYNNLNPFFFKAVIIYVVSSLMSYKGTPIINPGIL